MLSIPNAGKFVILHRRGFAYDSFYINYDHLANLS